MSEARKIKAMRIATRCETIDEFVVGFQAFCDDKTCFIPTVGMRPPGLETAFSIQLSDGTPMIRGLCVVLDAWETAENPYKRPGLRVGLRRLTPESMAILERLQQARLAALDVATARTSAEGTSPPPVPTVIAIGVPTSSGATPPPLPAIPPLVPLPPVLPTVVRPPTPPVPLAVLKIPPIGEVGTTPPLISPAALAEAAASPANEEFESPTLENKILEKRTPGSSFVLPANPLTALSDESIGAFVDCVLYEELQDETPDPDALSVIIEAPAIETDTLTAPPPILAPSSILVAPLESPRLDRTPSAPLPLQPLAESASGAVALPAPSQASVHLSIVLGVALAAFAVAVLVWVVALREGGSPDARARSTGADAGARSTMTAEGPGAGDSTIDGSKATHTDGSTAGAVGAGSAKSAPDAGSNSAPSVGSAKPADPSEPDTDGETAARTSVTTGVGTTVRPREEGELPTIGSGPCRISITSIPAGSTVTIDGQVTGSTPLVIAGPCKQRAIEVTRPRYAVAKRFATPREDKPAIVDITLLRPAHKLSVMSKPLGSVVSLNGKRAGSTPATIDVMGYSSYTITVERAGYKPASQRIYTSKPLSTLNFDLAKK